MYRNIEITLNEWLKKRDRYPLLVQGARQVGKTWSILNFGKSCFQNVVYLNFENNPDLCGIFERDLIPERIIREISVVTGETITEEKTLLFFDEIQSCPLALTSLKYFAEMTPGYVVVAAGSLLGVSINRKGSSFPVGKVEMLKMFPLGFDEFLIAVRGADVVEMIRESFSSFQPCPLHEVLNDLFRTYVYTGGMPQVVQEYVNSGDLFMADSVKKNISDAYVADMARYADRTETVRIMSAYRSLPSQLAKDNRKFQYSVIKKGARATEYESAVDWLHAAGIVLPCYRVSEGKIPLSASAELNFFKLYHSDTGILAEMSGITGKSVIARAGSNFRGALAENSVAAALSIAGIPLFYWESTGRAEIDFLITVEDQIIPLETKSSDNVRSKSLSEYVRRYSPPWSYRISEKNFGNENNIRSIPFYSLFCI